MGAVRELKHASSPTIFASVNLLATELPIACLDLVRLFGREAPLQVDLGCGDGSFLCELAEQFPDKNFLGIERLTKRVEKVRRKAGKIDNVRVLGTDTLFAARYLLPDQFGRSFLSFVSRSMAEAAASAAPHFHGGVPGCNRRRAGTKRRVACRDRSARLFSSNRTAKPRSSRVRSCPAVAGRGRSSVNEIRKKIPRTRSADLLADTPKNFVGQIGARGPFVSAKFQLHRASFILTEKFDAARANLVSPIFADPFAFREIL